MKSVEEIAREIVVREGGYADDPDDPGGATHHGVTLATLQGLGLDLTGDGTVDTRDLRRLSADQAVEIFVKHYYHRPRIDLLPQAVQASVFDMQVNAGAQAIRILQELLGSLGETVAVDGAVGPKTVAAARAAAAPDPTLFADAYGIARRNYYYALADRRPASRKYATTRRGTKGGWILRAEEFISPRFHLSAAQHRERVAQWG
ncbi:holin-associated N-acetylmuramidase [Rhodobacter maris]|uniref:Predicted peptidoglycan binding protein n=1 Tax=Rhodobacter maris TaxID=446682 RepID=A0A285RNJ2_9RHOB|nr:holin-associated N-acetylmuramidase [Rhodobacter maris]SOB94012.1 predicted peptidoglycan binding protein [Rhodobacter maris]